jgi:TatD DNase family protein
MELFDSHAHYDDERFDADRDGLLGSMISYNVRGIINAGSDAASSKASVELARKYPFIYAAVGIHPHEAVSLDESSVNEILKLLNEKKVVAVGEIGLDFFYDNSPRDKQRECFKRFLDIASGRGLPVIAHSREAAAETLEIIKKSEARNGVIHCFSYDAETALSFIDIGFHIGIGGAVTFKKSDKLREAVAAIPVERLLIETDAPYQTPVPHRGKRNDSRYLPYIVEAVAAIKQKPVEYIAETTRRNAERLFRITGGQF